MNTDLEMRITARNKTSAAFADLRGELARTGASMGKVEAGVSRIGGIIGALPSVFAAAFAGVSVASFARAVIDATHNVAELGREARATNVSFEGFQELGYAAERNQIAIADLGNGLREMQDKASEFAKTGGGRAAEALQTLGFDAKSTAAALKAPDQMFESIIDRLGQLDHASQIRFLGDIFGNAEGDKFLRLLDEGKSGIEALRDEAKRDGLVIGDEFEAAAERADLAFSKLWAQARVKFEELAVAISSAFSAGGNGGLLDGQLGLLGWKTDMNNELLQFKTDAALGADSSDGGIRSAMMGVGIDRSNPVGPGPSAADLQSWFGVTLKHMPSPRDSVGLGPQGWGDLRSLVDPSGMSTKPSTFDFADFLDKQDKSALEYSDIATGASRAEGAIAKLNIRMSDAMQQALDLSKAFRDGLTSAVTGFTDAILSGTNPLEAFEGLLGNLGKQLLNAGIQSLIGSLFPTTNVFAGSAFHGGWGAQGLPHFADGTMSAPAGLALVGERGPELVRFRGGEQVVPNGAFGGGGGELIVTVISEVRNGNLVPVMAHVAGQVAGKLVDQRAPLAVATAQRNKVF